MKISGPTMILLAVSVIPALGFGAWFAYEQLNDPDLTHTRENVLNAIEQSEQIRMNAEPDSIMEAREGSGFIFELGMDGDLRSKPLPGSKVSKFAYEVHSKKQCIEITQIFLQELENPLTVVLNGRRNDVTLWQGGNDQAFCTAAFEDKATGNLRVEYL